MRVTLVIGFVATVRVSTLASLPLFTTVPFELLARSANIAPKVPAEVASEVARDFATVGSPPVHPLIYTIVHL